MSTSSITDSNSLASNQSLHGVELAEHNKRITLFHELHQSFGEEFFILQNAWDALSIRQIELCGGSAVATTSLGMSAVFGYKDGEKLPFETFILMIECMVKVAKIPLSVDFEAGYGQTPDEICSKVRRLIQLGVVGINIEDADPENPGVLFDPSRQASKIKAIKDLASNLGVPRFFINARTDIYWQKKAIVFSSEGERFENMLKRVRLYEEVGADGIFVPGLTDLSLISKLAKETSLPINVQKGDWPSLKAAKLNGVSRISTGSGMFRSCAETTKKLSSALIENSADGLNSVSSSITYDDINDYFS